MVTDNKEIRCATCERLFTPARSDAQYCSSSCRQTAHRQKKPKANTELAFRSELTPRQERFVEAYASVPNGKAAAIAAGYSERSAGNQATRLLTHEGVKAAIRARGAAALARLEVTEERTMQELSAVGFGNIKDFLEWDTDRGLVVKDSVDIPYALAAAIASIEEQTVESRNKDGSRIYIKTKLKIKLHPKLPALQLISEYLNLTDSMAPKVAVYIKTGIDRTPEPVDVEAEAVSGD